MRKHFLPMILLYFLWQSQSLFGQVTFQQNAALMPFVFSTIPPCVTDFNNDFLDDVLRMDADSIFISFQNEDGTFSTQQTPHNFSTNVWSVAAGDFNNDHLNDFILGTVTEVVFVLMAGNLDNIQSYESANEIFSQRSNIVDINNDGWNDAFVCHDLGLSKPFKNDGTGNLTEDQTLIETMPTQGNYSSIWFDFDDDKDLDLYVSKCVGGAQPGDPLRTNRLYVNNGNNVFTEGALAANLDDNGQSWTSAIFDYDNDLDFDIYIMNHDEANRLMRNNGDGTFTDVIVDSGIDAANLGGFHAVAHDLDNNGFIDLITDLSNGIYFNNGDGTFTLTNVLNGWDFAIGDLNNDGFPDAINAPTQYINQGNSNHYLKINLQGVISNPNGIGARVYLYGADGNDQTRQLWSGEGFSVMSTLNLHFGLGANNSIDSLLIEWPSGIIDQYTNLTGDQTLFVEEGNTVGIEEPEARENFIVQYLGNQQMLSIHSENLQGNCVFKLFDEKGSLVVSNHLQLQDERITTKKFAGIYFYQILQNAIPKQAGKIIILK